MADYGRKRTRAEEQHLAVDSALDALSSIQHGDPELRERGRRTLTRLRAEDHR